jgi:CheY-like chemotaxis protein
MDIAADVVIVDDEKNIRFFAGEIFRLEGISAVSLSDGCQAVEYFETTASAGRKLPRIVILDVMMPCMTGLEVYDKVADAPWIEEMTFIITSASRGELNHLASDRVKILYKPYEVAALVDLVRSIAPDLFDH